MVRQGLPPLPFFFEYLGIRMFRTRRGEEKAPLTVVAPKMILMYYKVVDNVRRRVEGVGSFRLAYPRPSIRTIAVKSEGGIHVVIERDDNRGGLWWEQHTIRTGRVHVSIVSRVDIESKPVQMQRVI